MAIAIPLRRTWWAIRPSIRSPPSRTLPCVGRSSPTMTLRSVLLPAPFGPTTATMSPSSIPNVTPSTAGRPPKRFVTSSTSSSRSDLHGYDGGRYGVSAGDLKITLGQKVVDAVFNPASGGAPLVRMAYCGRDPIISPHAVHLSGHA